MRRQERLRTEERHGVTAEAVDADVEPELQHLEHGSADFGIFKVEIGLRAVEAVPEVLLRLFVVGLREASQCDV